MFANFTQIHRLKGKHTSGVAWIFSFLSLFFNIPLLYTFIKFGWGEKNFYIQIGVIDSSTRQYFLTILFVIHFLMVLLIFLLTCFADQSVYQLSQENESFCPPLNSRSDKKERTLMKIDDNLVDSFELNSPYEPNGTAISASVMNDQEQDLLSKPEAKHQKICPQQNSSFLSKITFWWFNQMAITGFRRSLQIDDLWELNPDNKTKNISPKFDLNWHSGSGNGRLKKKRYEQSISAPGSKNAKIVSFIDYQPKTAGIVKTLTKTFGWLFLSGAVFKLCNDLLQFISPQLLKLIFKIFSEFLPNFYLILGYLLILLRKVRLMNPFGMVILLRPYFLLSPLYNL